MRRLVAALLLALAGPIVVGVSTAASSSGAAFAWGLNDLGQLANGETSGPAVCAATDSSPTAAGWPCEAAPLLVGALSGARAVSAGDGFGLALLANGTVEAWGDDSTGELGADPSGVIDCATAAPCRADPRPVVGLAGVSAVAAGSDFGLALLASGTVEAWGDDSTGELGVPPTQAANCALGPCRPRPQRVPGLAGVQAIAAGGRFAVALLRDGTVLAWGDDSAGELGAALSRTGRCDGIPCSATPRRVGDLTGVRSVATGANHVLALLDNGTLRGWGDDNFGELGEAKVTGRCGGLLCATAPLAVPSLTGVRAVAAGSGDSLALLTNGTVRAWGEGETGQLGTPNISSAGCGGALCSARPVTVTPLSGVVAIAAGADSNVALLANGTMKSWGDNSYGELGQDRFPGPAPGQTASATDANALFNSEPVQDAAGVTSIAAGFGFDLALAS